jgi:nicotinamidase-related amidase
MQDLTLRTDDTLLLVIDVQDKLVPAMHPDLWDRMRANLTRLGTAAKLLRVPVLMSEQYPKGLGSTIGVVKESFEDAKVLEKSVFDAAKDEAIRREIDKTQRPKILVAGMETHICVYQTVRSLAASHHVHVLSDAVSSRTMENYEVGIGLIRNTGAVITSTETVLFDLLQRAGTDEFKTISKLVR